MGANEELIHKRACPKCSGNGEVFNVGMGRWITCDGCSGTGEVIVNTEL